MAKEIPLPLTDKEADERQLMNMGKTPLDMKRDQRQEWHMMLWLQGKTYAEICAITLVNRATVYEDLKVIQERWNSTPTSEADVRKLALMSLRITRSEIMGTIEEAKQNDAKYGEIAKLYDAAVDIDQTILQRYTQMPNETQAIGEAEERAMIVIDFFRQKYGPESLDGFEDYYKKRLVLKKLIPEGVGTRREP